MDLKKDLAISTAENLTGGEKGSQSNLLFQRSFSPSLSPSPSAGTGSLPPGPPSEPLSDTSVWTAAAAGSRVHTQALLTDYSEPMIRFTNDGPLPFSFCFLFHDSLGLSCDQQTSLLRFPACRTQIFWPIFSFLRSHLISQWLTQENIFSCLHKFKVPPDRLRDLWLCDTDSLYQSIATTEREKNANKP